MRGGTATLHPETGSATPSDPTCLWDNESILAWCLAEAFKAPGPLPSCQYPAKGTEVKTRNCPRAGLSGRCFGPMGRNARALAAWPEDPGHQNWTKATGLRFHSGQGQYNDTPTQEFAQSYLGRPKLWGAGRTGFCQDKHKRVREMWVWLINATHQQLWVCPCHASVIARLWREVPSATVTGNQIFQRRYFHLNLP